MRMKSFFAAAVVAVGCGGRTGLLIADGDSSAGGDAGSGGTQGVGGIGGTGGTGGTGGPGGEILPTCSPGWLRSGGSTDVTTTGFSLSSTTGGTVLLGGSLDGPISFEGLMIPAFGFVDAYIVEIDTQGEMVWSTSYGGSDNDWLYAAVRDDEGSLYTTGSFVTPLPIGGATITSTGAVDTFVAKLAPSGQAQWTLGGGSPGYDHPVNLLLSPDGGVYVTMLVNGPAELGGLQTPHHGGSDIVLAKLDDQGSVSWMVHGGGPGNDEPGALALADNGDILVGARFVGNATFGGLTASPVGGEDVLVSRVSPTGEVLWVATYGSVEDDSVGGLSHEGASILVAGTFQQTLTAGATTAISNGGQDVFAMSLEATGGAAQWLTTFGGPEDDSASSLSSDQLGNIFVAVNFAGDFTLGDVPVSSVDGSEDLLIVGLTPGGEIAFVTTGGGPGEDRIARITCRGEDLFVAGHFQGAGSFGRQQGVAVGESDAFLWRLPNELLCTPGEERSLGTVEGRSSAR